MLSSASSASLPSSHSLSLSSGISGPSRAHSAYPATAAATITQAPIVSPPPPATNGSTPNSPSVPVWRSVGEKSALRGYLATLGVTPEASLTDIRGAYKKLALQWHPDRSDAPNARLKFQEISQAYMALCVEEGDAQEVDVALYEKATQQQMQKGEQQFAPGLAGVTAGLAGVYSGSNGFYSHLNLPSQAHKGGCNSLLHPSNSSHLDLYHPHTHSPPTHSKHLHCSCLGSGSTAGLHTHSANCQCHLHAHAHSNGVHGGALTKDSVNGGSSSGVSELDVASAVQADLATSGVLPPPLVNVQTNSVQVSIYPLPNATVPVVYQVQLKIKKTYQLVWQSPIHLPSAAAQHQLLTYTVPNLVPGTKYLFRVRACPVLASGAALGAAIDSDDDPDGLDEIISDVADEATGLGVYSQPSTATTLGTRPEGNAPHPPVLSNLQLAALKKKSDKGNKKQQDGKKKPSTATAAAPSTPLSGSQQSKAAAAAASAQDSEDDKSSPVKPSTANGKQKQPASRDDNDEVDTEAESLASTPKRSMTRDASSSDLHAQTQSSTNVVSAPSTPSTSSAAAVAAASSSLAATGRKLSKKEEKEAKKAAEEERRRLEAESAQAKKLADEVAYQAYILEKRLEADRVRMEEEQRELEKYAQLKQEQDNKRLASEKAQQQAEEQNGGRKRGGKKNQQAAQNATAATASAPLLPTPPARGKGKQAAAAPAVAPVVPAAAAVAPILHIKLRADGSATGKNTAQAKDALLPTPASHEPVAAVADKKGGRKGRESKEAATASASVALAAQMAAAAPVAAVASASKPAWSLPSPALAPVASVAHSTPPSKPRDSPAVPSAAAPYTMPSPIIKASSKLPGAKAWTNVASPAASPAAQPMSSPPLQLSSHSPTFVPTSVSAANAAAVNRNNASDSLLSEHLNRFDATKPWQADQLLLYQQEQQRLREQQEQQQLQMQQQAQRQHEQLMRHHAQQQSAHDPTSRFHHIAAYTASHSLLSGGVSGLHSSLASTVSSDRSSSGLDSSSSLTSSVGWPEDDHHDALDDLAHEIERERWQATEHAQVAAQWNNTANTTLTSSAPSASGLHFTPLSSLRSDSLSGFGSGGASSVFMPPVVSAATRPPLPKSSAVNDYASRSTNDALGPALGSTASYQLQAQLASSNGGLGLNSFSTHGFPSTSGLSRAAPTFTPSSLGAEEVEPALPAPHTVAPSSISGHTRRPLPSSTREPAAPAVSNGLFSSFALPSFSSFSSNAFGAAPVTTSSAGSLNTDWSSRHVAHSSTHSLVVDDSDADLFSSRGSHGMQSALNVPQDHDDVTLIPGNAFGGNSSLGSSWLNGLSAPSKPQTLFSSTANDWPSHQ